MCCSGDHTCPHPAVHDIVMCVSTLAQNHLTDICNSSRGFQLFHHSISRRIYFFHSSNQAYILATTSTHPPHRAAQHHPENNTPPPCPVTMPGKPLRQQAAERARGNKPANPTQMGDPSDLELEAPTPDPVDPDPKNRSDKDGEGNIVTSSGPSDNFTLQYTPKERLLTLAKSALSGDTDQAGTEKVDVVGIGDGAGALGGVVSGRGKKGAARSKL
ncbi:hypothetical protein VTK26DRAFT_8460 [Humicola hyalothermophila]